jgi:hypothetical protein
MGLVDKLGLRLPAAFTRGAATDDEDPVDEALGTVDDFLAGIHDDKSKAPLVAELATLRAVHAKVVAGKDAGKVAIGVAKLLPAAKKLADKASAMAVAAYARQQAAEYARGTLDALVNKTANEVAKVAAPAPRTVLDKALADARTESARAEAAGDLGTLQTTVLTRLQNIGRIAQAIPKASAFADQDLLRADRIVGELDPAGSADVRARLQALRDRKKAGWPAGATFEAVEQDVDGFGKLVQQLIADAEALKKTLASQAEVKALAHRVDQLQPRIDKASAAGMPPFVERGQKEVRDRAASVRASLAKGDLKSAEIIFSALGAGLDALDRYKKAWSDFETRLKAATDGPIKIALALKLVPPELAASRDKAMAEREKELRRLAGSGEVAQAIAAIPAWETESKAWAEAKKAYDNLHGKKPDAGGLEKLAKAPGGGPVLDALVKDLPDDIPQEVLTAAIRARFGIKLRQFEHRKGTSDDPDKSTKVNPKLPDKDVKVLYSLLSKVPLKDVKQVEEIDRYTKESGGALYDPGLFNDKIALYCGRHDDGNVQEFNKPGEVVPEGQVVDRNCEPVNTHKPMPYFDFATLHEVGHAVDDAKNVMGAHSKDAGWQSHSASAVAKLAADKFGYDEDYIQDMMESKSGTPPAKRPKRPKGREEAMWDLSRQRAEAWVTAVKVNAGLWWHAGDSAANAIGDRVYHESYEGSWVSYKLAARAQGITGYQFRAPGEWFAELYAAFWTERLNPKHPAASWLKSLKADSMK